MLAVLPTEDFLDAYQRSYDPLLASYFATLRAVGKNVAPNEAAKLQALAAYFRAQGRTSDYRGFSFRSTQNAISSTTLFGFGGLTANNMTLIGSPTLASGGMALNGTTQGGNITDFLASDTLTIFARQTFANTTPSAASFIVAQGMPTDNDYSFATYHGASGNQFVQARSSLGTGASTEQYGSPTPSIPAGDNTMVSQWVSGGGRGLWQNKTALTLTLITGSANTSSFNSAAAINYGHRKAANFIPMTGCVLLFVRGELTDAQREAITDLVNAL